MSQVDDIKVRLILTVYEDGEVLNISSATSKYIIVKKPDGTTFTESASFLTDGSDGKIYYDTVSGDLDVVGLYKVQGEVVISSGTYRSNVASFKINCNL